MGILSDTAAAGLSHSGGVAQTDCHFLATEGEVQEAEMEKGDAEPAGERFQEKGSDEEEILRYEQDITELLLTIASLHGKIEHLQHQTGRDDEEFSDLGSEYTASLPRCPRPFPNSVLALPPPARSMDGHADLFLDVHKAMTSLEDTVLSHRRRIPSSEAELEEYTRVAESLEQSLRKFQGDDKEPLPQLHSEEEALAAGLPPEEMSKYKREVALYEQRNAALRASLEGKDEALRQSKTALGAYQEERDKLQRKVKELQDALSTLENLPDGFAGPVQEGGPWGFQECKSDSESLSMLLGRRESDTTALCLAVQYSERCLEAHEVLWSLTAAQQHPWKESAEDGGVPMTAPGDPGSVCHEMETAVMNEALRSWERCRANSEGSECAAFKQSSPEPSGLEEDRKEVLQEYIRRLRAEQASLKLPASRTPSRADSAAARINAGIGAKVAEVQRALCDVLPTGAASPKMEKLHLVQELQTTREALADLNIQLHLMGKEKQGLELRTYTLKAQEAACLLIIRILQEDCEKSRGQQSGSSDSSSSSSSDEDSDLRGYIPVCTSKGTHFRLAQDAGGKQPATDREAQMTELRETLARAMVHAYRNARRKQEAQVCQLEKQVGLMSHRQAEQLRLLIQEVEEIGFIPRRSLP
ncbi:PREDICTED: Usher syndrome type-1C protein-binding protein 1, partial [Gekko japonicus]|uniref:Usher syndrome type-1C protein-binding protein 1 n=1 Tax=Gekko japonicus TaxID=146911 RepID=A0ABM1JLG4_GEKJA